MRNTYIPLAFVALVMVGAVVFAFSAIGSPFALRRLKMDSARSSDLSYLKSGIESYSYSHNGLLPKSLADLSGFSSYTKDPETGKLFDYIPSSDNTSYQLCADFSDFYPPLNDANKNSYNYYDSYQYTKGHNCRTLTLNSYAANSYNSSATSYSDPSYTSANYSKTSDVPVSNQEKTIVYTYPANPCGTLMTYYSKSGSVSPGTGPVFAAASQQCAKVNSSSYPDEYSFRVYACENTTSSSTGKILGRATFAFQCKTQ